MSLTTLLNTSVDLQAETHAATGRGTHTVTWSAIIPALRCRIQPANERDRLAFGQMTHNITHVLYAKTRQATPTGYSSPLLHQICLEGNQKRVKLTREGVTRYLTVRGCRDFDEQGRLCKMALEEQPYSQVNA